MAATKRKQSASPPLPSSPSPKKKTAKVEAKGEIPENKHGSSNAWRFDSGVQLEDDAPWPAPVPDMRAATAFIQRLLPAAHSDSSSSKDSAITLSAEKPLVILPDKDADGLCSGQIFHRTMLHLGIPAEHIKVHHLKKGTHSASTSETDAIKALSPAAVVVLDQGSRPGPPLLGADDQTPVLVVDHHFLKPGEGGPEGSLMLNACHSLPVATASLLTWTVCRPLWTDTAEAEKQIDWLAVMGTAGDLSVNVAWDPPWPDLSGIMKQWTKKRIGTAIALLNAPRRTPEFDVPIAYASLSAATTPLELLDPGQNKYAQRLYAAREAVQAESERVTHTPPKFSKDGRIAVLFIDSPFQVHPSIATRWSGALRGAKKLEVIMCANKGYSPHGTHTHFSCRRAGAALKRGENPNIIALLHDYAARDPNFLRDVVRVEAELAGQGKGEGVDEAPAPVGASDAAIKDEGDDEKDSVDGEIQALNFARGHREASGGILPHALFQRFVELMEIGVPSEKPAGGEDVKSKSPNGKKAALDPKQKTKLTSFFAAKPVGASPKKDPVKKEPEEVA